MLWSLIDVVVCGELTILNSQLSLAMTIFIALKKFNPKEAPQLSLGVHSIPHRVSCSEEGQREAPLVLGAGSQRFVTMFEGASIESQVFSGRWDCSWSEVLASLKVHDQSESPISVLLHRFSLIDLL